ncbi:hypothetical protein VP01_759g2 [Puccinia sorghi]|uniref:Uncharacterized protein n=1 Tax=Puccinia sorghi TaxID=27349 RepID=A0A0L6UE22_9BASI|nr:hypothetical protein VP01_759g2 [Puccinia sorghi]
MFLFSFIHSSPYFFVLSFFLSLIVMMKQMTDTRLHTLMKPCFLSFFPSSSHSHKYLLFPFNSIFVLRCLVRSLGSIQNTEDPTHKKSSWCNHGILMGSTTLLHQKQRRRKIILWFSKFGHKIIILIFFGQGLSTKFYVLMILCLNFEYHIFLVFLGRFSIEETRSNKKGWIEHEGNNHEWQCKPRLDNRSVMNQGSFKQLGKVPVYIPCPFLNQWKEGSYSDQVDKTRNDWLIFFLLPGMERAFATLHGIGGQDISNYAWVKRVFLSSVLGPLGRWLVFSTLLLELSFKCAETLWHLWHCVLHIPFWLGHFEAFLLNKSFQLPTMTGLAISDHIILFAQVTLWQFTDPFFLLNMPMKAINHGKTSFFFNSGESDVKKDVSQILRFPIHHGYTQKQNLMKQFGPPGTSTPVHSQHRSSCWNFNSSPQCFLFFHEIINIIVIQKKPDVYYFHPLVSVIYFLFLDFSHLRHYFFKMYEGCDKCNSFITVILSYFQKQLFLWDPWIFGLEVPHLQLGLFPSSFPSTDLRKRFEFLDFLYLKSLESARYPELELDIPLQKKLAQLPAVLKLGLGGLDKKEKDRDKKAGTQYKLAKICLENEYKQNIMKK